MNRLKPIVAMLVLALFAFASSHPLLEGSGLIHHEVGHPEGPASSHADHELADGKCRIHSNRDGIQKTFSNDGFDLAAIAALVCVLIADAGFDTGPSIAIASSPPPELGTSWQFSFRTALPARAPSFAS